MGKINASEKGSYFFYFFFLKKDADGREKV